MLFLFTLVVLGEAVPPLEDRDAGVGAPARLPGVSRSGAPITSTVAWHDLRTGALYGDFERTVPGPELWLRRVGTLNAGESQLACPRALRPDLAPETPPVVFADPAQDVVVWLEVDGGIGFGRKTSGLTTCQRVPVPVGLKSNLVGVGTPTRFTIAWRTANGTASSLTTVGGADAGFSSFMWSLGTGRDVLGITELGMGTALFGLSNGEVVGSNPVPGQFAAALNAEGIALLPNRSDVLSFLRNQTAFLIRTTDEMLGAASRTPQLVETASALLAFVETNSGLVAYRLDPSLAQRLGDVVSELTATRENTSARLVFRRTGHLETELIGAGPTVTTSGPAALSPTSLQRNPRLTWVPSANGWAMSWEDWDGASWNSRLSLYSLDGGWANVGPIAGALMESESRDLRVWSRDGGLQGSLSLLADGGVSSAVQIGVAGQNGALLGTGLVTWNEFQVVSPTWVPSDGRERIGTTGVVAGRAVYLAVRGRFGPGYLRCSAVSCANPGSGGTSTHPMVPVVISVNQTVLLVYADINREVRLLQFPVGTLGAIQTQQLGIQNIQGIAATPWKEGHAVVVATQDGALTLSVVLAGGTTTQLADLTQPGSLPGDPVARESPSGDLLVVWPAFDENVKDITLQSRLIPASSFPDAGVRDGGVPVGGGAAGGMTGGGLSGGGMAGGVSGGGAVGGGSAGGVVMAGGVSGGGTTGGGSGGDGTTGGGSGGGQAGGGGAFAGGAPSGGGASVAGGSSGGGAAGGGLTAGGAPSAGGTTTENFVPVSCGCDASAAPGLLALVALVLRRRQRTSSSQCGPSDRSCS